MTRKFAKRNLWIGGAIAVGVLALGASAMRPRCEQVIGANTVNIPASRIARGAARFFCYEDSAGDRVRFILARDGHGGLHSVLDACRQCASFHKGYAFSHGHLVCRLCGNRYNLADMEHGKASCVPVKLASHEHDGQIEIKASDLKKEKELF